MGWFRWPRLPSFIPINYMASNLINNNNKGSTEVVKKSSRQVIERYYSRMTLDFHTNKKALEEVAIIPSKRPRNKIAGFSTHLMKQIQKGPVRGISLKLQEEERERRMDFVAEVSAIKSDQIEVDKETMDMLASLGMSCFPGLVQVDPLLYPLHSSGLEEMVLVGLQGEVDYDKSYTVCGNHYRL